MFWFDDFWVWVWKLCSKLFMTERHVQQNNVIGQNCCKQLRNDQWCNGNLVRKYYQMKPLWTFSIGKCIILLVEMEPTVFLPAKCDGLW